MNIGIEVFRNGSGLGEPDWTVGHAGIVLGLGRHPDRAGMCEKVVAAMTAAQVSNRLWCWKSLVSIHRIVCPKYHELRSANVVIGKLPWGGALLQPAAAQNIRRFPLELNSAARVLEPDDLLGSFLMADRVLTVHPFRDGNGRTVRFICMLFWGECLGKDRAAKLLTALYVENLPELLCIKMEKDVDVQKRKLAAFFLDRIRRLTD